MLLYLGACFGMIGLAQWFQTWGNLVHTLSGQDPLVTALKKLFVHNKSAAIVGREYLQRVPREANPHLLAHLIATDLGCRPDKLARSDQSQLRKLLQMQQRRDFELAHTVRVRGWILSRTEARLCGLAAML